MLKQFDAINTNTANHFVLLNCDWRKTEVPNSVLLEAQYKVNPVFWYKNDQNVVGDNKDLTYAVEMLLIGFKRGTGSEAVAMMDKDPTKRHNLIQGPALHTMSRYADGSVVNPHEKPEYIAKWVVDRYVMPRDWVVIVGAGAGGDARGYIKAGVNVVLIENDPKQYEFLCANMATLQADEEVKDAKQQKQAAKLAAKSAESSTSSEALPALCPGCGTAREKEPWLFCVACNDSCCRACIHVALGVDPATAEPLCSEGCFEAHGAMRTEEAV